MKATELAEALTIFASYDNDIEVSYSPEYQDPQESFIVLRSTPNSLYGMTKRSQDKLRSLGWIKDDKSCWYRENT